MVNLWMSLSVNSLLLIFLPLLTEASINAGVGIADATGPVAEITFVSYLITNSSTTETFIFF